MGVNGMASDGSNGIFSCEITDLLLHCVVQRTSLQERAEAAMGERALNGASGDFPLQNHTILAHDTT